MTRLQRFDLTPFNRASIGFDRVFNMITDMEEHYSNSNYPPYNIIELGDNEWAITLAVAGFKMENLEVTKDNNILTIEGNPSDEDDTIYLHKGIGMRAFRRKFTLAEYVEVKDATIDHGILQVRLVRDIPEEKLPKKIAILTK